MFQLKSVARHFGADVLFEDVTWVLEADARVGLVGPNGVGKTTLLRILAGEAAPDSGEVVVPKGARVGYLAQEIARTGEVPVIASVMDGAEAVRAAEAELKRTEAALEAAGSEATEALAAEHALALERYEVLGGHGLEAKAHEILRGLGFSEERIAGPLTRLSGGWVMRAALARLLLARPELLLLDEPTNHLDLESLAWLEGFLSGYPGAVAVVSHDRTFLNRLVDHVAELSAGGLVVYPGSYDDYVDARAALDEKLAKERASYEKRRREIQAFVDRFRAKATKARQAQSRIRLLEKMAAEQRPPPPRPKARSLDFALPAPKRAGRVVLTLEDLFFAFGETQVYDGLDLEILRGERVALVGENGAGKSTLLRLLAGDLTPSAGRRALGHKAESYYFAQHQAEALDGSRTILEEMRALLPTESESRVRGLLGAFLFPGEAVDKRIRVLSGGEKSRLALAKMLARPANVLLLDEPTNHLDLPSREVLESALSGFEGTMVFISHDRLFINRLATRVLEIRPGGRVTSFPGTYDDYLWKRARLEDGAPKDGAVAPAKTPSAAAKARLEKKAEAREAGRRRKTAARIESQIDTAEARMREIDDLLCRPEVHADGERTRALLSERETLTASLPSLYEAWEANAE